jgi:hypothetical protein
MQYLGIVSVIHWMRINGNIFSKARINGTIFRKRSNVSFNCNMFSKSIIQ